MKSLALCARRERLIPSRWSRYLSNLQPAFEPKRQPRLSGNRCEVASNHKKSASLAELKRTERFLPLEKLGKPKEIVDSKSQLDYSGWT